MTEVTLAPRSTSVRQTLEWFCRRAEAHIRIVTAGKQALRETQQQHLKHFTRMKPGQILTLIPDFYRDKVSGLDYVQMETKYNIDRTTIRRVLGRAHPELKTWRRRVQPEQVSDTTHHAH